MTIIDRIKSSFLKSTSDYEINYKSMHWTYYNNLKEGLFNLEGLKEFRNNKLNLNIDDKSENVEQLMLLFKKLLEKVGEDYILKNLDRNNIGNNKHFFKYKGGFVDFNLLHQINILYEITSLVKFTQNSIVCEIGGGYGHLSKLLLNNFNSKIILIDLPEANFLSSYYLMENFKDLKFLLYSEIDKKNLEKKDIINYDVVIIPPWVKVDGVDIDVFINIRSMMEMTTDIIKTYFSMIQKNIVLNGFFININRYLKNSVGSNVMLSDYPYDNYWAIASSKQNDFQPHVHQLITKRIDRSGEALKKELKSIEKFTKDNLEFVLHGKKDLYRIKD